MKENINLSIPSPCNEKWTNFTPTGNGGYCANCKKEVIDFTKWSDVRIKDYFANGGSSCGRFRADQLKTYSIAPPARNSYKFLQIPLLGATLLLNAKLAEAAEKTIQGIEIQSPNRMPKVNEAAKGDTLKRKTILGLIKSEEDQSPIPGVNVVRKGSNASTVSDADGKFTIEIQNPKKSDTLVFSFIGYKSVTKNIFEIDDSPIILELDSVVLGETVLMGGISARRFTPRTIWWRIRNIFR
jgi:hypothetical protein